MSTKGIERYWYKRFKIQVQDMAGQNVDALDIDLAEGETEFSLENIDNDNEYTFDVGEWEPGEIGTICYDEFGNVIENHLQDIKAPEKSMNSMQAQVKEMLTNYRGPLHEKASSLEASSGLYCLNLKSFQTPEALISKFLVSNGRMLLDLKQVSLITTPMLDVSGFGLAIAELFEGEAVAEEEPEELEILWKFTIVSSGVTLDATARFLVADWQADVKPIIDHLTREWEQLIDAWHHVKAR